MIPFFLQNGTNRIDRDGEQAIRSCESERQGTLGETELTKDTPGVKVPLEVGMLNEFIGLFDSHENLVNNVINSKLVSLLLETHHKTLAIDFLRRVELENPNHEANDRSLDLVVSFCVGGVVRMLL